VKSILTVAWNAYRESVRDKILYNLALFAIALILFSLLLGEWSVVARENVIKDFTLSVMSLVGLLMAVFVGIGLIQKELQRKTVLTLLAKPLPRWHFIVGKYLGLLVVLAINLAGMTLCFFFVLLYAGSFPDKSLLLAIYLIYMEMAVIVAVALLFSAFSTPMLSALFTLGVYVAGHLSGDILNHIAFVQKYGDRLPGGQSASIAMERVARAVYYLIPNLENFNISSRVVYHLPLGPHYVLFTTLHGLCFIAAYLLIACLWFNKRDFI
jgi:Cu-processing system permease protein